MLALLLLSNILIITHAFSVSSTRAYVSARGETEVKIVINKSHEIVKLHLKNKRKIDNNLLNSLNLLENVAKE